MPRAPLAPRPSPRAPRLAPLASWPGEQPHRPRSVFHRLIRRAEIEYVCNGEDTRWIGWNGANCGGGGEAGERPAAGDPPAAVARQEAGESQGGGLSNRERPVPRNPPRGELKDLVVSVRRV